MCLAALQHLLTTGQRQKDIEYRVKHLNDSWRWHSSNALPIRDKNDQVIGIKGNAKDITEHKQVEDNVRQLAFYDVLTGLPNRRLLTDRLTQAMSASKRSGRFGAVMFLDLDNFKPLNDQYGHGMGDLMLIEVARRLTDSVREIDTVARLGGDEFVVLLNELDTDKTDAVSQAHGVAEKIRSILSLPYLLNVAQTDQQNENVEHHCSASIGLVMFANHEVSQEEIIKLADQAMYQAKENGRNQIRLNADLGCKGAD